MGMIISYINARGYSNEPDPVTGLTLKEKSLVENSWSLMRKDLVKTGLQLLLLFLTKFPEHKKYFTFKDLTNEELIKSSRVKGHVATIMYALTAIIENINNNDVFIDLLQKNGENHAKTNIPEKSYWDLKETILELFEKALGSKFTNETKEAWDKMLKVAFTVSTNSLKQNR